MHAVLFPLGKRIGDWWGLSLKVVLGESSYEVSHPGFEPGCAGLCNLVGRACRSNARHSSQNVNLRADRVCPH